MEFSFALACGSIRRARSYVAGSLHPRALEPSRGSPTAPSEPHRVPSEVIQSLVQPLVQEFFSRDDADDAVALVHHHRCPNPSERNMSYTRATLYVLGTRGALR